MANTREKSKVDPAPADPDAEDAPDELESDEHDDASREDATVTDDPNEARRAKLESKIAHLAGCPEQRTETYEQLGPHGHVIVSRCQDCGGHLAQRPTEEPTLV